MTRFCVIVLSIFLLGISSSYGQVFPDCSNAVPICNNTPINGGTYGLGIDDFNGLTVSGCISQASGTIESNSAWYRFRTGQSGQLGVNIGFDSTEDWDFALYRTDDCSNLGDPVRCNYFDNSDANSYVGIGQDPTGENNFQYDDWLQVNAGDDYYLLINNFSNLNSGFSIQFTGTIFEDFPNTALDCSIISNLLGPPIAACENDSISLDATTASAISYEWYLDIGSGFQQIPAENGPLLSVAVSGMYRVLVVMPLGDNIVSEVQVAFSPSPTTDFISDIPICLDGTAIDLSLKDIEALGTQSPNEFRVTYHSSLADATNGSNALPTNFTPSTATQAIYVRTTSVENSNCYDTSRFFEINGFEVPDLDFPTEVYLCDSAPDAIIGELVMNSDYSYSWDSGQTTSPITVGTEGTYTLSVSNTQDGLDCIAIRSVTVVISRPPIISDIDIVYENDENRVTVIVQEEGNFEYQLDSEEPQTSPVFSSLFPGTHTITVTDINGCGSDSQEIVVVGFPKFFTPNGDGANDLWHVQGLSVLENPVVFIYDRFGKLVQQLNENSEGWDGSYNGILLPSADYWFKLTYVNTEGRTTTAKYINSHFSLKR